MQALLIFFNQLPPTLSPFIALVVSLSVQFLIMPVSFLNLMMMSSPLVALGCYYGIKKNIIAPLTLCITILTMSVGSFHFHSLLKEYQEEQECLFPSKMNIKGIVMEQMPHAHHLFKTILTVQESLPCQDNKLRTFYIYLSGPPRRVYTGCQVCISNVLFPKQRSPGYTWYLARSKVHGAGFASSYHCKVIKKPTSSLMRLRDLMRLRIFSSLKKRMHPTTFSLLINLLFGLRYIMPLERAFQQEMFRGWGLAHYLARSGLHLTILVTASRFITMLPLPYFFKLMFETFLILFYHFLSWPAVSFMRALLSFLLSQFARARSIRPHSINVLCLAGIITLLEMPLHITFLDFQLSYLLTAGVFFFMKFSRVTMQTKAYRHKPLIP